MSKQGWVSKQGGKNKDWKTRWLATEGDKGSSLAYYKKEDKKNQVGSD